MKSWINKFLVCHTDVSYMFITHDPFYVYVCVLKYFGHSICRCIGRILLF